MRPAGLGTIPNMDQAVMLLPEPDSPTMPRVSPLRSSKSIPSTALTIPVFVWK